MKAIVAVDEMWGIGKNNGLLFSISEDMKFFKKMTMGKVIVMGSNTLKSFPCGDPLKRRVNIVLWPGGEKRDDCNIVENLDELSQVLKNYNTNDVFVVGGAMFYRTMLPYCDTVYVTKVRKNGDAQVFFENLDELDGFEVAEESEMMESNGIRFSFVTYKNNNVKQF